MTPIAPVQVVQTARSLGRAIGVDSTANMSGSLAALAATTTRPTQGVLQRPSPGGWTPGGLFLVPIGVGADNDVYSLQVVAWRSVGSLWVPTIIFETPTVTLCTFVGVNSTPVTASERFADTIADPAAGKGTKNTTCWIGTPADNTPAHINLDVEGAELVQVRIGSASGAITGNALYAWL